MPQREGEAPSRSDPSPERAPGGWLSRRRGPQREEALPLREEAMPLREEAMPLREDAMPPREDAMPLREDAMSQRERRGRSAKEPPLERLPGGAPRAEALPLREEAMPLREEAMPLREEAMPLREEAMPQRERPRRSGREWPPAEVTRPLRVDSGFTRWNPRPRAPGRGPAGANAARPFRSGDLREQTRRARSGQGDDGRERGAL